MESWSEWKAKFSSKCGVCGREIPVGTAVHGTKDPVFSGKGGKWFVVCPDCYADGPKPKTLGSVAAEIEEMKTAGTGAPPPKFPTDVDSLVEFIKGDSGADSFGLFASGGFVGTSCDVPFFEDKKTGAGQHPTSGDIFAEIESVDVDAFGKKMQPKPWTLLWLREQAPWRMA